MGEAGHDGLAVPGRVVLAHEPPFAIGDLLVEPATRQVERGELSETIEPRVMQVLVVLHRAGRVVTREELIDRCWDGRIVGEDAINRVISRLRHIASGIGGGSFTIETIARVGYRLSKADSLPSSVPGGRKADRRRVLIGGGAAALVAAGMAGIWRTRPADKQIPNEARQLFNQAMTFGSTGLPEDNRKAIGNLKQAVLIAPAYAEAWGALALAYSAAIAGESPERVEGFEVLRDEAIRKAQEYDPGNLDALAAARLPVIYFGRWAEAEANYRDLIRRHSGLGYVNFELGKLMMDVGRWRDAVAAITAGRALVRPYPAISYLLSVALWSSGNIAAAEAELDEAMRRWPQHDSIWQTKVKLLGLTGRPQAAMALLNDESIRPINQDKERLAVRTAFFQAIATGDDADIDRATKLMTAANSAAPDGITYGINCAVLGRTDLALDMLEDAVLSYLGDGGSQVMDARVATHPLFQPHARNLWSQPRFAALLDRIGLEQYWSQAKVVPDFRR